MRTICIWENDMTDEIDPKVLTFLGHRFKGYDFNQLSGLAHRDEMDIIDSIRNNYAIIIQPNMLECEQVQSIAKLISHPIHTNKNSNQNDYEIQRFIFLSNHPWETLLQIKSNLKDVKDRHGELCIQKIIRNCATEFYNFDSSIYYELVEDGYWDTKAIRYK